MLPNYALGQAATYKAVADHHLHLNSAAAADVLNAIRTALDTDDQDEPIEAVEVDDVIEALDNAGVERGLVLSNAYMYGMPDINPENELPGVQLENNFLAEQATQSNGRLVGLCSVNPLADYAIAEATRCQRELELGGLKLHFANSDVNFYNPDHVAKLQALFRHLGANDFPALAHIRTRNPEYGAGDVAIFIEDILSEAPQLYVQIAHIAGWGGYDDATHDALGEFLDAFSDGRLDEQRIQFDLAAVVFDPAMAEKGEDAERIRNNNQRLSERIASMSSDRVIFASDWDSWPPQPAVEDKIQVYIDSFEQLLDITPQRLQQLFQARGKLLDR